jgi:hypothetical protein
MQDCRLHDWTSPPPPRAKQCPCIHHCPAAGPTCQGNRSSVRSMQAYPPPPASAPAHQQQLPALGHGGCSEQWCQLTVVPANMRQRPLHCMATGRFTRQLRPTGTVAGGAAFSAPAESDQLVLVSATPPVDHHMLAVTHAEWVRAAFAPQQHCC